MRTWRLICSGCGLVRPGSERASTCLDCGQPFLVEYEGPAPQRDELSRRWDMWRYASLLPLLPGEAPVTLAVKVTLAPNVDGLSELASDVVEAALITTCARL